MSLQLVAGLIMAYLLIMWLASILWVYRDIRSRSTDPMSHLIGVAIAVVFPIVGLPIYLILRPSETLTGAYDRRLEQEALLSELQTVSACPNCRRAVQEEFAVCAYCATPVKQACTRCARQLRLSWRVCPYCATPRTLSPAAEARYTVGGVAVPEQDQPAARVSASRAAAVEAIRRAAGRPAAPADQEDASPASRLRPRPRTDADR